MDMSKQVRALVDAGFQEQAVVAALARSNGDADEATLLLLGDELTPLRVVRRKMPSDLEVAAARRPHLDGGGPDWGHALPQEVLEVLGKWLNQHLGAFDCRPRLKPVPEYLHPLAINKFRATHNTKELEAARTRLVATREMLLALRACRQSCRVWRDEISYKGVTELALDGVMHVGRLSPVRGLHGLPSLDQMASDASHASSRRCPPNVYTWWPGHRTLQIIDQNDHKRLAAAPLARGQRASAGGTGSRCPACRTAPVKDDKTSRACKHPMLQQFMKDQGIGNWFGAVTMLLSITSIADLRKMTTYELMELSRRHNYSESQMLEAAPKVIAKIKAGGDWESRKTGSFGDTWLRTNSERFLVHTHCDECGCPDGAMAGMTGQPGRHVAASCSTNCETCGLIYCADCGQGNFNDSRPQNVEEILPTDFSDRFCNLDTLSLCDLELSYLPSVIAQCSSLTSLNASGNCLRSLGQDDQRVGRFKAGATSLSNVLPPGLMKLDLSGRSAWADVENAKDGSQAPMVAEVDLPMLPGAARRQRQRSGLPIESLPTGLQELRLSNLNLQRVPLALRACKQLRMLDLSHNNMVIRRNWTGLLPVAAGGTPGGGPWEEGDLSADVWISEELGHLEELNLASAVTVIGTNGGDGAGGGLTPAQIAAATAYFTQRDQLRQQRVQTQAALSAAQALVQDAAQAEHDVFKRWQAISARAGRAKAVYDRCNLGEVDPFRERLRLASVEAVQAVAQADSDRTSASAEHAEANIAHTTAMQAHQAVATSIANLGPAPVAIVAWHAHLGHQQNIAAMIRKGTPLTEPVLPTLDEELWLRKWSGRLELSEREDPEDIAAIHD